MIEFGIAGAALLIAAWLFETLKSIKLHKSLVDLKFAAIYMSGTMMLAVYSFLRKDMIFLSINIILITLVSFEILYTIFKKK
jgi:hypothetical protein